MRTYEKNNSNLRAIEITSPNFFRYQINARTDLAIRYNDISPLENHHCAVAFQILSNPETNIFSNVDAPTFKRIRSVQNKIPMHYCTMSF